MKLSPYNWAIHPQKVTQPTGVKWSLLEFFGNPPGNSITYPTVWRRKTINSNSKCFLGMEYVKGICSFHWRVDFFWFTSYAFPGGFFLWLFCCKIPSKKTSLEAQKVGNFCHHYLVLLVRCLSTNQLRTGWFALKVVWQHGFMFEYWEGKIPILVSKKWCYFRVEISS